MSNTEQALSAVAGGVVGFFLGGPAGAFAGIQYGLLAGSLLFPADLPSVYGPRLEDFEALHADPGAPVILGWGTFVVPGFRMYLGEPVEIPVTENVGGKGAPSQEVTTYTYTQTLALGLCEGPITGILRIWENGELVYDARDMQDYESTEEFDARVAKSAEYADTFTLYLGTEEQLADPTLELELGVGNVPAFREIAYIVFPDRLLKVEQANRHPAFKIEIETEEEVVEPFPPFYEPPFSFPDSGILIGGIIDLEVTDNLGVFDAGVQFGGSQFGFEPGGRLQYRVDQSAYQNLGTDAWLEGTKPLDTGPGQYFVAVLDVTRSGDFALNDPTGDLATALLGEQLDLSISRTYEWFAALSGAPVDGEARVVFGLYTFGSPDNVLKAIVHARFHWG